MATEGKTFTITLAEGGENHVGMELVGTCGPPGTGWKLKDLQRAQAYLEGLGKTTELYNLNKITGMENVETQDAFVLVVRQAFDEAAQKSIKTELTSLTWDAKYWDTRRKRVLNKLARQNLMWSETAQEPDFEHGKGTIVAWDEAPQVASVRDLLGDAVGEEPGTLIGEGNY